MANGVMPLQANRLLFLIPQLAKKLVGLRMRAFLI
jgi:hypothetical protein